MIKINIDILLRYGVTYSTQIRLYSERGVKVGNDQMEKLYIKYYKDGDLAEDANEINQDIEKRLTSVESKPL